MFTGIVQGSYPITFLKKSEGLLTYAVQLPKKMREGLSIGASVSIEGVCQTVTRITEEGVFFDAIEETLNITTLGGLHQGDLVHVERSARYGDEIGGHMISGHIVGTVEIAEMQTSPNNLRIKLTVPQGWRDYILEKGFVALNGVSLTVCNVTSSGSFEVCLIPETLRICTFAQKHKGDLLNLEIDLQTRTIVDNVKKILLSQARL